MSQGVAGRGSGTMGRSAFLRRLSGAGLALVAVTAARVARARPAAAHPCPPGTINVGCCCLSANVTRWCEHLCPPEQSRQWTCCLGGRLISCFECTEGDTCFEGPFRCSSVSATGTEC